VTFTHQLNGKNRKSRVFLLDNFWRAVIIAAAKKQVVCLERIVTAPGTLKGGFVVLANIGLSADVPDAKSLRELWFPDAFSPAIFGPGTTRRQEGDLPR
jgi:hypothetical protein